MSTSHIRTFEDLDCWKTRRELRLFIAKKALFVLPWYSQFPLTGIF